MSGQLGRLPEPRQRSVAPGFAHTVGRSVHTPVGAPVHVHTPPCTHGCTCRCTPPCAHVKTAPCTRAPVRTVVFQPEWPTATVCAFSRAIRIVSGQPGRLPEPRRRPVAPGFGTAGRLVWSCAHPVGAPRTCTHRLVHCTPGCTPPCAHVKTAPCMRAPVRTVKFQPDRPTATVCAPSRAIRIVSGQLGRLPEPRRRPVAPCFARLAGWLVVCTRSVRTHQRCTTVHSAHTVAHTCVRT